MTGIAARIAAHAAAHPDDPALTGAETVTFADLTARTHRLAHWLGARRTAPESVVAICLPRTPDLVATVLGTLAAGMAYLPMDASLPPARRDYMAADAGAVLTVTEELLDRYRDEIAAAPAGPPGIDVEPGRLAYVIYTSGSTGRPKGVMVQRDQLDAYLDWAGRRYLDRPGGAPLYSPINVDLSVTSLLLPLWAGRPVALLPAENPPVTTLPAAVESDEYAFVKVTPAHLALLGIGLPGAARTVGRLVIGGEALTYAQLRPWRAHAPQTEIVNEYGPTETVVGCCVHVMAAGTEGTGAVPIGAAVPGTRLSVRDDRLRPVPDGATGELYIGGAQVTRGYLGRPGLTATRYRPDPDTPGGRMYRSGDLVRRDPDGALVYLGRRDDQIKLNGHRIELTEIESVLGRQAGIAAAAVAVRGRDTGRRLVAYLVPAPGTRLDPTDVRREAGRTLPPHMIPMEVIVMSQLPVTSGGKIDRAALDATGARHRPEVAAVVADVIGHPVPPADYDVDIPTLGGSSLQIAMVVARLIRDHGISLPAESWLYKPTVSGFAELIEVYADGGAEAVKALHAAPDLAADLDDEIFGALDPAKEDHDVNV